MDTGGNNFYSFPETSSNQCFPRKFLILSNSCSFLPIFYLLQFVILSPFKSLTTQFYHVIITIVKDGRLIHYNITEIPAIFEDCQQLRNSWKARTTQIFLIWTNFGIGKFQFDLKNVLLILNNLLYLLYTTGFSPEHTQKSRHFWIENRFLQEFRDLVHVSVNFEHSLTSLKTKDAEIARGTQEQWTVFLVFVTDLCTPFFLYI